MIKPDRKNLFSLALLAGWLTLAATSSNATIVTNNFDDGTTQGWVNVLTSPGDTPRFFEVSNSGIPALGPQSGAYRVVPDVTSFGGNEDSHHDTLVFRSPQFTLGDNGSISFYLGVGAGGAASPGPNFAGLAAASTTPGSTGSGFMGLALRRVSDGAYVLSERKSVDGVNWELHSFSNAAILANNLAYTPLTLDLIDNFQGGFGWVALDTVTIFDAVPEPSSVMLMSVGGWLLWRRRRQAAARG